MAVSRVHHTGVVVRSLEQACAFFRDTLGLPLLREALIDDQGVKAALLDLGNPVLSEAEGPALSEAEGGLLELLEPVDPDTGIARYLEQRGEGLHHVCLEVDDITAALAGLKAKGVPLVDEEPRPGLVGSIAFLHPSALHGVLVELVDGPTALRDPRPAPALPALSQAEGSGAEGTRDPRPPTRDPGVPPASGAVQRLDHLVFAVQEMAPALAGWARAFGLRPDPAPYQPPGTHMELGVLRLREGPALSEVEGAFLELVRPTSAGHRVARFLAERGEGMFSVSLQVDDLDAAVRGLRAKGVPVSEPEPGVYPGTKVARIPRASAHGVAVQLIQRAPPS